MVSTQENDIKVEYDSKMLHDVLNKKLDRKHPKYIYIHTNKVFTDSHIKSIHLKSETNST